jgi:hypothetical protein
MIGSDDGLQPRVSSDGSADAGGGLSDDECVQRLQTVIANHAGEGTPATQSAAGSGAQPDGSTEAGELGEVAALIGRLAVPLEY